MGHRTLCLDCDVGLRNLDLTLGMSDSALMDFTDVIAGRATLEQAAVRHPYGCRLYLLTAPVRLHEDIRTSEMKALLDEVVVSILYSASDKPLKERINFKLLDQDLKAELMNNGVNIGYHFTVSTQDGREVYRCPDYSDEGEEYTYTQILFRNDPVSKMGVVKLHFPDMNSYIYSSIRFMIPSVIFTVVLLITLSSR